MSDAPEASIIPDDIGDSICMFGAFIAGNHFRVYEFMPAKGHEKMNDAGRVVETTRRLVSIHSHTAWLVRVVSALERYMHLLKTHQPWRRIAPVLVLRG